MWLVLAAAAVLAFAGTLRYDFVWDDHYLLSQIEDLWRTRGLRAVVMAPFLPQPGVSDEYYRPVVALSMLLDSRIGGGSPGWFHLTNVLLHGGCTLLGAAVFLRLVPCAVAAFAGSLLFALHPVHAESVAFVSARTDLLATLFTLVAVLSWHEWRHANRRPRGARAVWLAASAVSLFVAVLSKENAALLPLVLLAWDLWETRNRQHPDTDWWRRNRGWLGLHGAALAVVFLLRQRVLLPVAADVVAASDGTGPLLVTQPGLAMLGALRMCRALILPWPHNALYTREQLAPDVPSILAVAAVCGVVVWTTARRFRRVGAFSGAWIAAFMLPALFVPSGGVVIIAERFLYLPSLGFCLAVGALLGDFTETGPRRRAAALVVVSVGALILGASDVVRAEIWRNDLTLATDMVRTSPDSALAHDALGQALLKAGRYREALEPLLKAVRLEPVHPAYHNDLGIAFRRLDQPALAAHAFRESLRLDPNSVGTRLNLAYACITLRDAMCIEEQRRALATADQAALAELERTLRRWWR
jgi:hypothetical protein